MKKNKINYDVLISLIILIISIIIFIFDTINCIKYDDLGFDGAYNATVAKNFSETGEYKVSYMEKIDENNPVFYNIITTGQTVILPTALFYKIFGITNITTCLAPLIYSIGCFILLYILFSILIKEKIPNFRFRNILSALFTVVILFTDCCFYDYSTHLYGESASLFFILFTTVLLIKYSKKQYRGLLFFAGFALSAMYISKPSMLFIFVGMICIMLLKTILKKQKISEFLIFILGIIVSYLLIDLIKIIQLGGIIEYINWHKNEWINILTQSGGNTINVIQRLNTFSEVLNPQYIFSILLIFMPFIIYSIQLIKITRDVKNKLNENIVDISFAASSLLIYYLLRAPSGLNNIRRISVNTVIIRIFFIYLVFSLVVYIFTSKKKKYILYTIIISLISMYIVFPFKYIKKSFDTYFGKYTQETNRKKNMEIFLKKISNLPEDAKIYVLVWWQEPNITLFLNREQININRLLDRNNITDDIINSDNYLVIGRLYDCINLEANEIFYNVKFELIDSIDNINNDFANEYSIYKLHINKEKNP